MVRDKGEKKKGGGGSETRECFAFCPILLALRLSQPEVMAVKDERNA